MRATDTLDLIWAAFLPIPDIRAAAPWNSNLFLPMSMGDLDRGAASPSHFRQRKYTGTPVRMITSPGHVVDGWYTNKTSRIVAAPRM